MVELASPPAAMAGFQSSRTLATLLNDALIAISASPAEKRETHVDIKHNNGEIKEMGRRRGSRDPHQSEEQQQKKKKKKG